MPVQAGLGTDPIAVAASDTTLLADPGASARHLVTSVVVVNDTAGAADISIYDSPDTTSASGELLVEDVTVAANSTEVITELSGVGFASGRNIIGVGSAAGLTAKLTYTLFTGGA